MSNGKISEILIIKTSCAIEKIILELNSSCSLCTLCVLRDTKIFLKIQETQSSSEFHNEH